MRTSCLDLKHWNHSHFARGKIITLLHIFSTLSTFDIGIYVGNIISWRIVCEKNENLSRMIHIKNLYRSFHGRHKRKYKPRLRWPESNYRKCENTRQLCVVWLYLLYAMLSWWEFHLPYRQAITGLRIHRKCATERWPFSNKKILYESYTTTFHMDMRKIKISVTIAVLWMSEWLVIFHLTTLHYRIFLTCGLSFLILPHYITTSFWLVACHS